MDYTKLSNLELFKEYSLAIMPDYYDGEHTKKGMITLMRIEIELNKRFISSGFLTKEFEIEKEIVYTDNSYFIIKNIVEKN